MSRDWRLFLDDILECCRRVRSYTAGLDQAGLVADLMAYDAVLRNLEIVGEAAKKIPPDVRQQMPDIEWTKIAGMRDWLAHAYFHVNADIVWDVVQNKLPDLEQTVQRYQDAGSA
ncbi:MAG: DUF86 domain-containing protein [Planctomycetes bacterium]|nr:DUF86 domain-containing protein [Planctomycetota bacterium]